MELKVSAIFPFQSGPGSREPDRKVAVPHGLQTGKDRTQISRSRPSREDRISVTVFAIVGFAVDNRSHRALVVSLHRALLEPRRIWSGDKKPWPATLRDTGARATEASSAILGKGMNEQAPPLSVPKTDTSPKSESITILSECSLD